MKTPKNFQNLILLGMLIVFVLACHNPNAKERADINITYELPGKLAPNASQTELANFAWQEFFAVNWQSSWNTDNKRDNPDTSWDFATGGAQPDLAVWETLIHRTELRPANGIRFENLNTGKPKYTFINNDSINYAGLNLDDYWNVLDEDNEIGSAYLFAHYNEHQVLYAAKTNLVEYNYVKKYFPSDKELKAAGTLGGDKGVAYLKTLTNAQMCKSDSLSSLSSGALICLPCGDEENQGVLEVKLAFRKIDVNKGDDPSKYLTKEVVVFKPNTSDPQYALNAETETFGLIGIHIIRKMKNYPAFVFASWEQVDERNKDIQTMGIYGAIQVDTINYYDVDPLRLNPVIERVIPETLQEINAVVQDKIRSKNADSKWQYYQLIGVQGTPIDYTERTSDNNYFMANYVIESDLMLTNFHGSFPAPFDKDIENVVFNHEGVNMGGCQGCHGRAQTANGTDFSFLLDFGAGKPVPLPDPYQTCDQACVTACTIQLKNNKTKLDTKCMKKCQYSCNDGATAFTPKQTNDVLAYIKTLDKK